MKVDCQRLLVCTQALLCWSWGVLQGGRRGCRCLQLRFGAPRPSHCLRACWLCSCACSPLMCPSMCPQVPDDQERKELALYLAGQHPKHRWVGCGWKGEGGEDLKGGWKVTR